MSSYVYINCGTRGEVACELVPDQDFTVGRSRSCSFTVDDDHCSKVHVRIYCSDGQWYLSDEHTSNGTMVNSQLISQEHKLANGDFITIGSSTRLEFSSDDTTEKGTISNLLDDLKAGPEDAQQRAQRLLFEYFYEQLCSFARRKSKGLNRAVEDEHDAVNSALGSVFNAIENEKLPKVDNRNELWSIMAAFTAWKVHAQRERQFAKKRGAGAQPTNLQEEAASIVPVDANAILSETISNVRESLDEGLRAVFDLRMTGHTNVETAVILKCTERTIERKLKKIREICDEFI